MDVEVIRSINRHKTVQARVVDGRLVVRVPSRMSAADERRWVGEMTRRFSARRDAVPVDLARRAKTLASRHGLPTPSSIRWVTNQRQRWGSCTIATRQIRISDRLGGWPPWVLDYVIVHELAHLVVPNHGRRFQALVDRYPRAERARGFLIAKAGTDEEADDVL